MFGYRGGSGYPIISVRIPRPPKCELYIQFGYRNPCSDTETLRSKCCQKEKNDFILASRQAREVLLRVYQGFGIIFGKSSKVVSYWALHIQTFKTLHNNLFFLQFFDRCLDTETPVYLSINTSKLLTWFRLQLLYQRRNQIPPKNTKKVTNTCNGVTAIV